MLKAFRNGLDTVILTLPLSTTPKQATAFVIKDVSEDMSGILNIKNYKDETWKLNKGSAVLFDGIINGIKRNC